MISYTLSDVLEIWPYISEERASRIKDKKDRIMQMKKDRKLYIESLEGTDMLPKEEREKIRKIVLEHKKDRVFEEAGGIEDIEI